MTSSSSNAERALDARAIRFRRLAIALLAIVLAASFAYAPWVHDGPVLCASRLVAGLPCPSCGLTRSFCATAQGEFGEAFRFHAFGPPLFALFALAIPVMLAELARGRRFERLAATLGSTRVAWTLAALLAVYHLARLGVDAANGELAASLRHSLAGTAWHAL